MCQLIFTIYLNKYHFAIALFLISQKISTTNKSTTIFEITLSESGLNLVMILQYAPCWHKKPIKTIMKGTTPYLTNSTSKKFYVVYLEICIHLIILNIWRLQVILTFSVMHPDIFGGDQFQQRFGGRLWHPYKSRAKPWWGTRGQSSWKLQGFSTLKSLTFD